jgi:hypothetical protein
MIYRGLCLSAVSLKDNSQNRPLVKLMNNEIFATKAQRH